jgi:flagellar hook-length control protein FliK
VGLALPTSATPAKDAKTMNPDGKNGLDKAANLAVNGQVLPSLGETSKRESTGSGEQLRASPTDTRLAMSESRVEPKAALINLSSQVEAPLVQAPPTILEPSRELLAQRVAEQLPRLAETPSLSSTIQAPLRSVAFNQEFGDRLVWMATRHAQSAELTLNPPQLGSVEVRLSMNGNEAGAQFYSANPQVREALDQALPKLREIMAGAGITLGQATVSDQAFSRQEQPTSGQSAMTGDDDESLQILAGSQPVRARMGLGLVDLYA